ncbi:hypothetical protein Pan44_52630 [Caulifigura coniformis]|uniref:Lipoprotein n=1 Tax=Caulifigura coniformis TaxID=2527983 RepID=A0A517SM50_9PLAN|nr:hypothetical protein [Caulifigura coniformis]QDT57196.1 hypothetical protein Pan44_52630 [Caulifigura coniformis]
MSWRAWDRLAAWRQRYWQMTPAVAALFFGGCAGGITTWIPGRAHLHNSNCSPLYARDIDDCITAHRAKCASRECLKSLSHQSQCDFSSDYAYGFEQAFVDVAQGGWGVTPAVPPRRYWGLCYRTESGKQQACDWLAGYTAGAERALAMLGKEGVIASAYSCGVCGGQCGGTCDAGTW